MELLKGVSFLSGKISPFFCPWFWDQVCGASQGQLITERDAFVETQSCRCGHSMSRRLIHLLTVHIHCVPRCHLFLGDVFLLSLQLFLITSFGHCIPKKPWQRQRCEKGRDKALSEPSWTPYSRTGTYPHRASHIPLCCDKTSREIRPDNPGLSPTLPLIACCLTWGKSLSEF